MTAGDFTPQPFTFDDWNPDVITGYLRREGIVTYDSDDKTWVGDGMKGGIGAAPAKAVLQGTFRMAGNIITHTWSGIKSSYDTVLTILGAVDKTPVRRSREDKRNTYIWTTDGGAFPPHLRLIPRRDAVDLFGLTDDSEKRAIFNLRRLLGTAPSLMQKSFPAKILDFTTNMIDGAGANPAAGQSKMDNVGHRSRQMMKDKAGVQNVPNISERNDWFMDAVFAQQFLTGPNPMILKLAPTNCLEWFLDAAQDQNNQAASHFLQAPTGSTLWVADYSYLRKASGVPEEFDLYCSESTFLDGVTRYGCASVALFELTNDGYLHPVAILIDFRETVRNVIIFNKRLRYQDPMVDEDNDWPWRFAKTCVLAADWVDHELRVHLTNTHLVEEACIIAAQRSFPDAHPIYDLLSPHWLKTLTLNAAARSTLVPKVVCNIGPFNVTETKKLIHYYYNNFNWVGGYVPVELAARGINEGELNTRKFHNFTYARNMSTLWPELRKFVANYLDTFMNLPVDSPYREYSLRHYLEPDGVKNDPYIKSWVSEMHNSDGAKMQTFPNITSLDELIDALTMTIHIASPQHTAVNYLQVYYQAFVAHKPPAIYKQLPKDLAELNAYTEDDLIKSLPIREECSRQWLLASHLPWLLSAEVDKSQTLYTHIQTIAAAQGPEQHAAQQFLKALDKCNVIFEKQSNEIDVVTRDKDEKHKIAYTVMSPVQTAVSILI